MKIGDLVRTNSLMIGKINNAHPDLKDQVGLVVAILPPYAWAEETAGQMLEVLFPTPLWATEAGTSIMWEKELEVINESR
jgi:hypothetical protein